jgi:hypothetical protein
MQPLYAARVTDLKPGDFVIVECVSCGHDWLIHPAALPSLGLGSNERIVDFALAFAAANAIRKERP